MAKAKKNEIVIKEEKEVNDSVDLSSIKDELTLYIDKEIKKSFDDEIKKVYAKTIREKNRKLFFSNILILLLVAIVIFLLYVLYDGGYFDKYFNSDVKPIITDIDDKPIVDKPAEPTGPTLDELKEEFGYLLDNVVISEDSLYIGDYYKGILSNELKNYLATSLLDISDLPVDDDCNIIDGDLFNKSYSKLFDGEYSKNSYDYNDNRIRFINKLNSFITTDVIKNKESNIKREIIDIQVSESYIAITTIEGVVKDGKLYNVVSKDEVKNYKKDSLSNYSNKLNKVTYTFKDNLLDSIK